MLKVTYILDGKTAVSAVYYRDLPKFSENYTILMVENFK